MPAASVSSENTKPARISSRPCCIQKGRLSSQTASLLPKTTNCRATPGRRHEKDYFRIFPSLRRSALMLCMERTLQIHLENMADAFGRKQTMFHTSSDRFRNFALPAVGTASLSSVRSFRHHVQLPVSLFADSAERHRGITPSCWYGTFCSQFPYTSWLEHRFLPHRQSTRCPASVP